MYVILIQAYVVLLHFALLHLAGTAFLQIEGLWLPYVKQIYWSHISENIIF